MYHLDGDKFYILSTRVRCRDPEIKILFLDKEKERRSPLLSEKRERFIDG